MDEQSNQSVETQFLDSVEEKPFEIKEEPSFLDEPLEIPSAEAPEAPKVEEEPKAKNRRERRLLEQNDRLRDEVLMTNRRLDEIAQAQALRQDKEADYLQKLEKIYGTATPEGKEATELLKQSLKEMHESTLKEAEERAFGRLQSEREAEARAVKEEENNLEDMLDRLEDERGANFDNDKERTGFLNLLEKLSPKDKDGNIIEYADAHTTWETYNALKDKSSRAKELSSRSMSRSGASPRTSVQDDATERYLKSIGFLS